MCRKLLKQSIHLIKKMIKPLDALFMAVSFGSANQLKSKYCFALKGFCLQGAALESEGALKFRKDVQEVTKLEQVNLGFVEEEEPGYYPKADFAVYKSVEREELLTKFRVPVQDNKELLYISSTAFFLE